MYGLGILLTVEDQATKSIMGVDSSLQKLSTTAMSLTYMGKNLIGIGTGLLKPLIGLGKEVIRVNSEAEKTRITLSALYDTAEAGAAKYNEIIAYAATTPFEIEELKTAAITFKTLGVEILGVGADVTSTSGKTRQFMNILGDLGAGLSGVARNGFKDVTYAVKEFVTEGNQLSFLRRLGIDIGAVLEQQGMAVADTIEGRLQNMADLAEILKFEGLTEKMFGTWGQVISNMSDVWTMFLLRIGDADVGLTFVDEFGNTVFGGFKRTLDKVAQMMTQMTLVDGFATNIGKALFSIMQPIDWIASKLVGLAGGLVNLIAKYPSVAKFAMLIPTIAGALFIMAGAGLVAKGAMLTLGYGLSVVAGMLPAILGFAAIFGVIGTAWAKDIGGIQTRLNNFTGSIHTAFSEAERISGQGVDLMISDYKRLLTEYENTGNKQTGLTVRILEWKALWKGFVDYWNTGTLSDANYNMLEQMGLLPVFTKIAVWTDRFKAFCSGVVSGFSDMVNAAGDFAKKVIGFVEQIFPPFGTLVDKFSGAGGLMDGFSLNADDVVNAGGFEKFGNTLGKVATVGVPALMLLHGGLKKIGGEAGASGGLAQLMGQAKGIASSIPKSLGDTSVAAEVFAQTFSAGVLAPKQSIQELKNLSPYLTGFTNNIKNATHPITKHFSGLGTDIKTWSSIFGQNFGKLNSEFHNYGGFWHNMFKGSDKAKAASRKAFSGIFKDMSLSAGLGLKTVGKDLLGGFGSIGKSLTSGIGGIVKSIGGFQGAFSGLTSIFSKVGFGIASSPIFWVLLAVVGVIVTVAAAMRTNGQEIMNALQPVIDMFNQMGGLSGILQTFMGLVSQVGAIFKEVWQSEEMQTALDALSGAIVNIIGVLSQMIASVLPMIMNLIQQIIPPIAQLIANLLPPVARIMTEIINIIAILIPPISEIINAVIQIVSVILPPLIEILDVIIQTILSVIEACMPIITLIAEIVASIVSFLVPIIQWVINFLVTILVPAITAVINIISSIITGVANFISAIIQTIIGVIQGIINFIVNVFTGNWAGAWEAVKSIFSSVWEGIKNVFKSVVNGIIGIFNGMIKGLNKLKIPDWVPGVGGKGLNIPLIPTLAKGTENFIGGLAVMNEVGGELVDLPRGARVYPHDESLTLARQDGMGFAMNSMAYSLKSLATGYARSAGSEAMSYDVGSILDGVDTPSPIPTRDVPTHVDNSVHFEAGSIVIKVEKATDAEAEAFAEKIMQIIEKKQRRKKLATYQY